MKMRVAGLASMISAFALLGASSAIAQSAIFNATNSASPYGMPQTYMIPQTGEYEITALGASGGSYDGFAGGLGAEASGAFNFTQGEVLTLYVGSMGGNSHGYITGGGGGGSFVVFGTVVLAVGGGGGGAFGETGLPAGIMQDNGSGLGGSPGSGRADGAGGGVNGNGSEFVDGTGGQGLTTGTPPLQGGMSLSTNNGGYGGGGAGFELGGGGGGYSGGGFNDIVGSGGTSFVDMSLGDGYVPGSASFMQAAGTGDGEITITELSGGITIPEPASLPLLIAPLAVAIGLRVRRQSWHSAR